MRKLFEIIIIGQGFIPALAFSKFKYKLEMPTDMRGHIFYLFSSSALLSKRRFL